VDVSGKAVDVQIVVTRGASLLSESPLLTLKILGRQSDIVAVGFLDRGLLIEISKLRKE
jgi:hypothetical protein